MKQMTPELLTVAITHANHGRAIELQHPEGVRIPQEDRIREFDKLIEMETQFKTALQEVAAWRERFPEFTYRRIDECIERMQP
jgi:hypothetical protein